MTAQLDLLGLMAPPLELRPIAIDRVDHTLRGADQPGSWDEFRARWVSAEEAGALKTIRWGGERGTPHYYLTLWNDDGWRFMVSYEIGTGGGGGPPSLERYGSADAATVAAARRTLRSAARAMATAFDSERVTRDHYGKLVPWLIGLCDPARCGGVNLRGEYVAMVEEEVAREKRRLIALRAAHDLSDKVEAISRELCMWSYASSQCSGSLIDNAVQEPRGDESHAQRAAIWPARWSVAGHSPDALELHTYPSDGHAASPVLARFIAAVKVGAIVEILPAVFPGHDFGDILQRRKALIEEGRVQLATSL